jgi:hypothetical protein
MASTMSLPVLSLATGTVITRKLAHDTLQAILLIAVATQSFTEEKRQLRGEQMGRGLEAPASRPWQ